VLYAGCVVEEGPVEAVLHKPQHPYTHALLEAVPRPDGRDKPLPMIAGSVPPNPAWPQGCPFRPRCPSPREACRREMPVLRGRGGHRVACHLVAPRGEA
jgi:oligopeptide/dipeptide ABC transporter ATP-binding protein